MAVISEERDLTQDEYAELQDRLRTMRKPWSWRSLIPVVIATALGAHFSRGMLAGARLMWWPEQPDAWWWWLPGAGLGLLISVGVIIGMRMANARTAGALQRSARKGRVEVMHLEATDAAMLECWSGDEVDNVVHLLQVDDERMFAIYAWRLKELGIKKQMPNSKCELALLRLGKGQDDELLYFRTLGKCFPKPRRARISADLIDLVINGELLPGTISEFVQKYGLDTEGYEWTDTPRQPFAAADHEDNEQKSPSGGAV